jgi:hypothetical protein
MVTAVEMLRQGRMDELWKKYCGFFDLTIEEFMKIQERLLAEQLQLLAASELGWNILGGEVPLSPDEFRRVAPVTTYKDYLPYLPPKRGDALPAEPIHWMRTSGRSGEYPAKWVPCSRRFYAQVGHYLIATLILASAREKGDIRLQEGDTFLYAVAPPPYLSGTTIRAASDEFPLQFIPSIPEAEAMEFQDRMTQGFLRSVGPGIDYFVGLASVLLRMGEALSEGSGNLSLSPGLLRPTALYRIGKALLMNKLHGRKMLPQDLWNPKGIVASGMDVQVYRQRIESYWGRLPLEAYACTEFGTCALQAWAATSEGLTFAPDSAFWEFMPEDEYQAWRRDPSYQPKTLLLDEVQPGRYILLATSLAGGAFVRYFIGDLIRIIALSDDEVGIRLPQMVMESRADDVIDMGSLVYITERGMWQAIGGLGLPTIDWAARKEYGEPNSEPFVHVYIEADHLDLDNDKVATALHNGLMDSIDDYATYYKIMETNPIRITRLAPGTFQKYLEEKQAEGADLGHLKPPRVAPSEQIIDRLSNISAELDGGSP